MIRKCRSLLSNSHISVSPVYMLCRCTFWETNTNTVKWNRRLVCLWSKMSTFQTDFCPLKMLACPCPPLYSITLVRAFKWGTVWHSTSRGIRTTRILSLLLLSKVESLNLQVVAVLMPIVIKHHTVPHLKSLNSGLEP